MAATKQLWRYADRWSISTCVVRGAERPLVVDYAVWFLSIHTETAVASAIRILEGNRWHAVKMEVAKNCRSVMIMRQTLWTNTAIHL